MQFGLVARTWRWEKDNVELATVWVWKSYYKSSNFVSISCVPGFEMEHKFHKTCAWGIMFLCPPKIGFLQGSTSVVCCVIIYFLLLWVTGRYLRILIHQKNGDIKIYNTNTCKDVILVVCLLCLITLQITLFSTRRSQALGRTLLILSISTIRSFLFTVTIINHVPSRWLEH